MIVHFFCIVCVDHFEFLVTDALAQHFVLVCGFLLTWYSVVVFAFRWPAMCIHGDKSQPERDWVLNGKHPL